MNWYLEALKKYAVFRGRARRREYWYFMLFSVLAMALFEIVGGRTGGILLVVYALLLFLPSLAVSVRRLHDTNRSGWWLLINMVPFIGAIVLFVFLVLDSQRGENQYGPNPKAFGG
jgi:uncharacterized membrane protein YhaH (DUF805 family)